MDKIKGKALFLEADRKDGGIRLDTFVSRKLASHSRSSIQGLIKGGNIKVNDALVKPNYRLRGEDRIEILIPPPKKVSLEPENIDLEIIYQDADIAVINKPQGMVVHPGPGNYSGTMVNALLDKFDQLSGVNGKIRPGIVHRLDKETSGLIVIAKNDYAHEFLAKQLAERTAYRVYWAIVENNIKEDSGTIDAPIRRHPIHRKRMTVMEGPGSRRAITHFRVLERFGEYTLVEARLETGRTHQIRVHMAYIKHPILGDQLYGSRRQRFNLKGQALHAVTLGFVHPSTGEFMKFDAPLPEYFRQLIDKLQKF